jgi:hypothetical protein
MPWNMCREPNFFHLINKMQPFTPKGFEKVARG